jgi:hypothetical protein
MEARTLARISGIAGLAFVIGGTAIEAIFPAPVEPGGTAAAILQAGAQPGAKATVALLAATTGLGTAILVIFAASFARYLDPDTGLLAQLAVLGALAAFVLSLVRRGLLIAFAQTAGSSDQSGAAALFVAATDSLVRVYAYPDALFIGALGLLVVARRALPVWLGWTALGIAAIEIIGAFAGGVAPSLDVEFPAYLLSLVWIGAVSAIVLVRSARSSSATTPQRVGSTA